MDSIENEPIFQYMCYIMLHISICVCVFLTYVMLRFKELQTRYNRYFFHYVVNTLFYFVSVMIFRVIHLFSCNNLILISMCVLMKLMPTFAFVSLVFVGVAVSDWFLTNNRNNSTESTSKLQQNVINFVIYFTVTLYAGITGYEVCSTYEFSTLDQSVDLFIYTILLIIVAIINICSHSRNINGDDDDNNRKHILKLGNLITLGWFPLHLGVYLIFFKVLNQETIVSYFYLVNLICTINIPLLFLGCFIKWDKNFRVACKRVFGKKEKIVDPEFCEKITTTA